MKSKSKIEFVKETKVDGGVIYYTTKNGSYISESTSLDENKGRELCNMIVERGDLKPIVEVLETKYSGQKNKTNSRRYSKKCHKPNV